jgi:hypothetical protein
MPRCRSLFSLGLIPKVNRTFTSEADDACDLDDDQCDSPAHFVGYLFDDQHAAVDLLIAVEFEFSYDGELAV